MRDINLQSTVLTLEDFPQDTRKVMFLYDDRGWALRCYNENGDKLTTLIFTDKQGLGGTEGTLYPELTNSLICQRAACTACGTTWSAPVDTCPTCEARSGS